MYNGGNVEEMFYFFDVAGLGTAAEAVGCMKPLEDDPALVPLVPALEEWFAAPPGVLLSVAFTCFLGLP